MDCSHGVWSKISSSPLDENRVDISSATNGKTVVVGGGYYKTIGVSDYFPDSALYDPETDSWTSLGYFQYSVYDWIFPMNTTYGRLGFDSFWTLSNSNWEKNIDATGIESSKMSPYNITLHSGDVLSIIGFYTGSIFMYRSQNGLDWKPFSTSNNPPGLKEGVTGAVSDSGDLFLWGGLTTQGTLSNKGYLLPSSSSSWKPTSTLNAPSPRSFSRVVWAGDRFLVWGGYEQSPPTTSIHDGAEYFPETDTWSPLPAEGAPKVATPLFWTGKYVIFWGEPGNRRLYDVKARVFVKMSACGEPTANWPAVQWTKTGLVVWGGSGSDGGKIFRLNKNE